MKLTTLFTATMLVALSAPTAFAQQSTDNGILNQAQRFMVRAPGDTSVGLGHIQMPTADNEGTLSTTLQDANGKTRLLNGTLTTYTEHGGSARFVYGGFYGRLDDSTSDGGTLMVLGEWVRYGELSPNGQLLAMVRDGSQVVGLLHGEFVLGSDGTVQFENLGSLGAQNPAQRQYLYSPVVDPGPGGQGSLGNHLAAQRLPIPIVIDDFAPRPKVEIGTVTKLGAQSSEVEAIAFFDGIPLTFANGDEYQGTASDAQDSSQAAPGIVRPDFVMTPYGDDMRGSFEYLGTSAQAPNQAAKGDSTASSTGGFSPLSFGESASDAQDSSQAAPGTVRPDFVMTPYGDDMHNEPAVSNGRILMTALMFH